MRRRPLLSALVVLAAGVAAAGSATCGFPGEAVAAPPDTVAARGVPAGVGSDSTTGAVLPWRLVPTDTLGVGPGGGAGLLEPSGLAGDAFGRVTVADAARHRLVRFTAAGDWLDEAGALGSGPGELRRPGDVAAVGTLGMAVLDRENRRVVLYDLFGRNVGVLGDLAALEDALGRVEPVALAADRGGALYVADADRDRVLILDFSGRLVRVLGGYGAGSGSFRGLSGLASGPRGELVSVERTGARVQRFAADGSVAAVWPLAVRPGRGRLAVAVDDSARVAVADESGNRLWLFDGQGRVLARGDGLAGPAALHFGPDGDLFVAEAAAGRVRRLALVAAAPGAPPGR